MLCFSGFELYPPWVPLNKPCMYVVIHYHRYIYPPEGSSWNSWRAASLSDRNMGGNLSPIWPEGHCLNSAKHRPLTAWNHTWAEMRISFRGLLWSFIRHIFQPLILADTTKKLMRRTQLKKEPDRMKIAPKQCISWKTCGGVEEFCNKQGILQNQYAFIYRRWTKCSDLNSIEFTLTINSNSFYSSFLWRAEFK